MPDHPRITFVNIARDWQTNPRIPIRSVEQLRTLLAELSDGEPGFVELESAAKDLLQLGIGGPFACAQFTNHDNTLPYLIAKARTIRATEDVEFSCDGTPTPFPPELCFSFEEAVKVAEHFFNTGDRDPNIEWVAG